MPRVMEREDDYDIILDGLENCHGELRYECRQFHLYGTMCRTEATMMVLKEVLSKAVKELAREYDG